MSFYGLKQASREIHKLLASKLLSYGFEQCLTDTLLGVEPSLSSQIQYDSPLLFERPNGRRIRLSYGCL